VCRCAYELRNALAAFYAEDPLMKYDQPTGQFPIRWHLSFQLQLCYSSVTIGMCNEVPSLNLGLRELTSVQHFVVPISTSKRTVGWHNCAHVRFRTWKKPDRICTVCRAFWRILSFTLFYRWHQALSWNKSLPSLWPSLLIYHSQSSYHSSGAI
jgi:hypothetical protein